MVKPIFILLGVAGLTSVGTYLFGVRGLGLAGRATPAAIGKMLECVGATICFFVANLAVGGAIIVVVRDLTTQFVSLYLADDLTLLGFSLLQGLTFQWWWELSDRPHHRAGDQG